MSGRKKQGGLWFHSFSVSGESWFPGFTPQRNIPNMILKSKIQYHITLPNMEIYLTQRCEGKRNPESLFLIEKKIIEFT